ncbi:hypothetical protein EJK15_57040 [Nonomuraea basaltis]|nr:hypothetical protein EJK15_57040 [Nonomuraea basaltis]
MASAGSLREVPGLPFCGTIPLEGRDPIIAPARRRNPVDHRCVQPRHLRGQQPVPGDLRALPGGHQVRAHPGPGHRWRGRHPGALASERPHRRSRGPGPRPGGVRGRRLWGGGSVTPPGNWLDASGRPRP